MGDVPYDDTESTLSSEEGDRQDKSMISMEKWIEIKEEYGFSRWISS